MKTPTDIHPDLTEERLCVIGNIIRQRTHSAALRHLPGEGDNLWVLGCRRYQWILAAVTKAANADNKDWLKIIEDGGVGRHFVFSIGVVPIRFYRGDPEDVPAKVIACSEIEDAAMQSAFPWFVPVKLAAEHHIRIAYGTDAKTREATEIKLIVVDDDLNQVGDGWVIPKEPTKIKRFLKKEEGRDLGKPSVGSQKKQEQQRNGED